MDTTRRSYLIFIFCLLALTGYGQNQRAQSFTGTVGITGAVVKVIGGATFDWGNTVLVDGVNGNDTTGTRTNGAKPFQTLTAAKNAAVAGDWVYVRPSTYLGTNLLKPFVNYYFEAGSVVTNVPALTASTFDAAMFHDYAGPTTNIVAGEGEFRWLLETNVTSTWQGGVVSLSNAMTRLRFRGSQIQVRHFTTDNQSAAFRIINCGEVVANVGSIYDPDVDRQSFNPLDPPTEIFSQANGIYWQNGNCFFFVATMDTENGYSIWSDGNTNSLYYRGLSVRNRGGNAFYNSATSGNNRTWLEVLEVDAMNQSVFSAVPGSGRVYFTGQKIRAGGVVINGVGQEIWISAQKITTASSGYFVDQQAGKLWINCLQYETEGPLNTGPAFRISGGTNYFFGGSVLVTNATAFLLTGSQSTRVADMTVQTVNQSGSGNTNSPFDCKTNGLTLQNMTLLAPAGVDSVKGTNVINPITVEGSLQVNTAPGPNTVLTNGIVLMNGAVQSKLVLASSANVPIQLSNTVSGAGSSAVWQVDSNGLHSFFYSAAGVTMGTTYPVSGAGTSVILTNYPTLRLSNGFRDDALGTLTNLIGGYYLITGHATLLSSNTAIPPPNMRITILTNGTAANLISESPSGSNRWSQVSVSGIRFLPANTGTQLRITNLDSVDNVTNRQVQFSITQL